MQIPFSMLRSAGSGKAVAVLALLAGLYIVTAMKNRQQASTTPPRR